MSLGNRSWRFGIYRRCTSCQLTIFQIYSRCILVVFDQCRLTMRRYGNRRNSFCRGFYVLKSTFWSLRRSVWIILLLPAYFLVDIVLFEQFSSKLFYQMLDVCRFDFDALTIHLNANGQSVLFCSFFRQILQNSFETVSWWNRSIRYILTAFDLVVGFLARLVSWCIRSIYFPDLNQLLLDLGVKEFLIIEDLFEIIFGIIIQL